MVLNTGGQGTACEVSVWPVGVAKPIPRPFFSPNPKSQCSTPFPCQEPQLGADRIQTTLAWLTLHSSALLGTPVYTLYNADGKCRECPLWQTTIILEIKGGERCKSSSYWLPSRGYHGNLEWYWCQRGCTVGPNSSRFDILNPCQSCNTLRLVLSIPWSENLGLQLCREGKIGGRRQRLAESPSASFCRFKKKKQDRKSNRPHTTLYSIPSCGLNMLWVDRAECSRKTGLAYIYIPQSLCQFISRCHCVYIHYVNLVLHQH